MQLILYIDVLLLTIISPATEAGKKEMSGADKVFTQANWNIYSRYICNYIKGSRKHKNRRETARSAHCAHYNRTSKRKCVHVLAGVCGCLKSIRETGAVIRAGQRVARDVYSFTKREDWMLTAEYLHVFLGGVREFSHARFSPSISLLFARWLCLEILSILSLKLIS